MSIPPACGRIGTQCRSLRVTLRIGSLSESAESLDHEATWLLGHTEQISFRDLWKGEEDLYVDATLHVPCRYLDESGDRARCRAHGFERPLFAQRVRVTQPRQLGGDRFRIVEQSRPVDRALRPPPRTLPVLAGLNPCKEAPCRTADNIRGAACCRDLQLEIMCTRRQRRLEELVRSRRAPYLCKISREGDYSVDAEMISACGYLRPDTVDCTLHGRQRPDGRPAKPDLCTEWPENGKGLHPGCVFIGQAPAKRGGDLASVQATAASPSTVPSAAMTVSGATPVVRESPNE